MRELQNRYWSCGSVRMGNEGKRHSFVVLVMLWLLLTGVGAADAQSIVRVPLNQSTIQGAINIANIGDTVLVAPGTYTENINFNGKAITVRSEGGATVTVIDGNSAGAAVIFANGEGVASKLIGFTVANGSSSPYGGGVHISSASPTVEENIVINNAGTPGIRVYEGGPIIRRNVITGNADTAIQIWGGGSAQVINNILVGNMGGGVLLMNAVHAPLIRGNIISGNVANVGGGISIDSASNPIIVQNLIVGNAGGGIIWSVPPNNSGPLLVNNTIADNDGAFGSGIYAEEFAGTAGTYARFFNNIIVAKAGQVALYCHNYSNIPSTPLMQSNNIYAPSGVAYGGFCSDVTGTAGNVSVAPLFADQARENYRLRSNSPLIDAGFNLAPELPRVDLDGTTRIRDGDGDAVATVDMGAYEFSLIPAPVIVSVGTNELGTFIAGTASVSRVASISNVGPVRANVVLSAIASNDPKSFTLVTGGPAPCPSLSPVLDVGTSCTVVVSFAPNSAGLKNAMVVVMVEGLDVHATSSLKATVLEADATPDTFGFAPQLKVGRGSTAISNSVTVTGINAPIAISVIGGEYSIDGGAFTANPGKIENGQSISVRLVASFNYGATTSATLTIGTASAVFRATTLERISPTSHYFPLDIGNSWVKRRNGVEVASDTITSTQLVNGVVTFGVRDAFDGSISYYGNDVGELRLHRVFTPSIFVPGCGAAAETDTYSGGPLVILPTNIRIGQVVPSQGDATADVTPCGVFPATYSASSIMESIERVSVPAGLFDALKVRVTLSVLGISMSETYWFAPGVGRVKVQYSDGIVDELVRTNLVRTTPDEFSFTARTNVLANSPAISESVAVAGITAPATVSISGGEYSIDGGAFTSQSGNVINGQGIRVRLISSPLAPASKSATLTIGGVTASFYVTTVATVPTAPTAITAKAGFGSVEITFGLPSSNGGVPITSYTATCASSNGGVAGFNTSATNGTSTRVSGLTNGKSYSCTVSASNSMGVGPVSETSNLVMPLDLTPILNLLLDDSE